MRMLRPNNWRIPKQSGSCLKLPRATSDWLTPHKSVRAAQSQGQADRRFSLAPSAAHFWRTQSATTGSVCTQRTQIEVSTSAIVRPRSCRSLYVFVPTIHYTQRFFSPVSRAGFGASVAKRMTLFFFHVRDGLDFICDPDGSCFPDVVFAKSEAIHSARELMRQSIIRSLRTPRHRSTL